MNAVDPVVLRLRQGLQFDGKTIRLQRLSWVDNDRHNFHTRRIESSFNFLPKQVFGIVQPFLTVFVSQIRPILSNHGQKYVGRANPVFDEDAIGDTNGYRLCIQKNVAFAVDLAQCIVKEFSFGAIRVAPVTNEDATDGKWLKHGNVSSVL